MEVAGQHVDDAKVTALLEQLKVAMESQDGRRATQRLMRGGPFGQEWADFIYLAMELFAPPAEPPSQEGV